MTPTGDSGDSDDMEAIAPPPGGRTERVLSGEFRGVTWQVTREGDRVALSIGGRSVHVAPDGIGSFVTHEMVGRWRDLSELAQAILRYHPGYSPLARPRFV